MKLRASHERRSETSPPQKGLFDLDGRKQWVGRFLEHESAPLAKLCSWMGAAYKRMLRAALLHASQDRLLQ